ncbi:hypothetical protein [Bacillus toyonensis]|uniref:hypothetical protein n=2 Tax=Bacillus toyonensis TaxID=155322 RepID=UPI0011550A5F|nr:hypothetical protein [Bacillus toyonensis]MEC2390511.1 hypothetical protein [Bacillus toyonensis]
MEESQMVKVKNMLKRFRIIDLLFIYIVAYVLVDQPSDLKKIVFFLAGITIFILEKVMLSSKKFNQYLKNVREGFISDVLIGVLFFWYIFNVLNIATLLVLLIICILKFKEDIDVLLRK